MDSIDTIPKMKVADLKKHLKSRGLSVSGNKTELVERLQKSLQEGNDAVNSSGANDEEDFDEEEILGDDVDDDSKISPQEEAAVLSGAITIKDPEKKKIVLRRSEASLKASISKEETTSPTKDETQALSTEKSETTESGENKENSHSDEVISPKRKMIKLSTDEEETEAQTKAVVKKASPMTEEERKQARMARFGPTSNKPSKLSMETGGTDVDKLKKRAERFGEITSKALTKVDSLEKKKQREERFGGATATPDKGEIKNGTDDPKAARAARFGSTDTKSSTEDELKKKRAERFAAN